ncbi:unknown [[Mannheimia] succiniciproducens MBEL55E]|uniref:Uncharacterized protein n=1 Tax=Mannheimia succiniciproducens (strain KCTC 0769BP / MBEL55E) TaxID=221988 RepID=Q65RZ7_MANSM|nr:unknown [[Mannheimia] succiniciproducens MBEL55E]
MNYKISPKMTALFIFLSIKKPFIAIKGLILFILD